MTDAAGRLFPEEEETPVPEDILDAEPDVIIDATAKAAEETEEDAPEA